MVATVPYREYGAAVPMIGPWRPVRPANRTRTHSAHRLRRAAGRVLFRSSAMLVCSATRRALAPDAVARAFEAGRQRHIRRARPAKPGVGGGRSIGSPQSDPTPAPENTDTRETGHHVGRTARWRSLLGPVGALRHDTLSPGGARQCIHAGAQHRRRRRLRLPGDRRNGRRDRNRLPLAFGAPDDIAGGGGGGGGGKKKKKKKKKNCFSCDSTRRRV